MIVAIVVACKDSKFKTENPAEIIAFLKVQMASDKEESD